MYRVYGMSSSGNCYKVRLLLTQLAEPFEWIETSTLKKETRTPEFLKLNANGKIPLLQLEDGRLLPESDAILCYLAEGTVFLPANRWLRAEVLRWMFWEQYSHETAIAVLRFQKFYLKKPDSEIDPNLRPRCLRVLSLMDEQLEGRDYFVGKHLSLADIALVAYTRFSHQADIDLKDYPHVTAWVRRVETDLGLGHLP